MGSTKPNFADWRGLSTIEIWEIAVLMCGFDPRAMEDVTVKNPHDPHDTYGVSLDTSWEERTLRSAVLTGDIQSKPENLISPDCHTNVTLDSLIPWLYAHGHNNLASALSPVPPISGMSNQPTAVLPQPAITNQTVSAAPVATPIGQPKVQPQPLATKTIAVLFDGLPYTPANWPRRLSTTKWLQPANRAPGEQGGASAQWCPLNLAQLVHGREKDKRQKQKTIKALNSRFNRFPMLAPWRDEWAEHYSMFSDARDTP